MQENQESHLIELIDKYDPRMNQADKEYLLQLEDRPAVIKTLESKLKWCDEVTDGDEYSMGAYNDDYDDEEDTM